MTNHTFITKPRRFGKLTNTIPFDVIPFLYRRLSGYGEKWNWASGWILIIWLVFAMLYYSFGSFGVNREDFLSFGKSFGYIIFVMTLQKSDPRPYDWNPHLFYGLQTIFASIQAALLALATRRKFMR